MKIVERSASCVSRSDCQIGASRAKTFVSGSASAMVDAIADGLRSPTVRPHAACRLRSAGRSRSWSMRMRVPTPERASSIAISEPISAYAEDGYGGAGKERGIGSGAQPQYGSVRSGDLERLRLVGARTRPPYLDSERVDLAIVLPEQHDRARAAPPKAPEHVVESAHLGAVEELCDPVRLLRRGREGPDPEPGAGEVAGRADVIYITGQTRTEEATRSGTLRDQAPADQVPNVDTQHPDRCATRIEVGVDAGSATPASWSATHASMRARIGSSLVQA